MKEYLFSYGTLQKEKVQIELYGRHLNGTKDILRGYKSSPIKITDDEFLARGEEKYQLTLISTNNENDFVEGKVFEISEEELRLSDKYEPDGYKRINVELDSGKTAWIYAFADKT